MLLSHSPVRPRGETPWSSSIIDFVQLVWLLTQTSSLLPLKGTQGRKFLQSVQNEFNTLPNNTVGLKSLLTNQAQTAKKNNANNSKMLISCVNSLWNDNGMVGDGREESWQPWLQFYWMVGVTDVDLVFLLFIYLVQIDNCNHKERSCHLGFSNAEVDAKCLFNWQRLNSLRCFLGGGGWGGVDTFCSSGKLFTRSRKLFRIIGRGNLQIVFTPTPMWVGRVHKRRRAPTPGEEGRKKKNCDFPHYLDYSCKGSVDRKPRVFSQQEIQ